MANTFDLTDLTEVLYAARDQVARELVGFIPSVTVNGGPQQVSLGGTVESLRTLQGTIGETLTPSMTPPDGVDQKPEVETMTITKTAVARIPMTGESALKLRNTGAGRTTLQNTFAQHLRKIVNTIEGHLGATIYQAASRATGTAGTTPFAADHKIINSLRKILDDNGTPEGGRTLVINSTAGVNLRNLTQLTKANEAGSSDPLRRGTLLDLSGFLIKESAGVRAHTKGTGAGYLIDLAEGYAAGTRTLHVDTGAGTILPGDAITVADDPSAGIYIVNSGFGGDGDGDIVIGHPGLTGAIANNKAVTIGNNYTANAAFHQSSVELVMRPPAVPEGGDLAVDRTVLYDEKSGLSFEVSVYRGYRMLTYEIACHYQAKVWNPEFVAVLMG